MYSRIGGATAYSVSMFYALSSYSLSGCLRSIDIFSLPKLRVM